MQGLQVAGNDHRLQPVQHLDPALDLLALGSLVPEALDELLRALDLGLLTLEGSLKLLDLQPSLILIEGIVSAVACEFCIEEFVDLIDRIIQKALVVADNQQRTFEGLEEVFQPEPGLDIQIVGRLVKHHQVRALAEHLGKRNAHLISA